MKLKQILKNKQGVAIENAVLFMIVIFFLCTLITSLTLLGFYEVKLEKELLLRDVAIDQIGEDYLASVEAQQAFNNTYDKYAYEVKDNVLKVWREKDADKTVVLYVEAELTADNQVNVIAWRYSELPTQTE